MFCAVESLSSTNAGLLCALLAVAVHLNTLDCGFCYDDKAAILQNKDLLPHTPWRNLLWNDFWGTPLHLNVSHKSYRPLCVATFRLNYLWAELEPMGYHLVNVLLHGVVCYLYVALVSLVCSAVWPALIAGLLFAVHPIHTEAVAGVVGRAELLAAVFYTGSLLLYHKAAVSSNSRGGVSMAWLSGSMMLTLCSLLSKESGLTVTALCVVYDYFILHRGTLPSTVALLRSSFTHSLPKWVWSFLQRAVVLIIFTGLLLSVRLWMSVTTPQFDKRDNEALMLSSPYRQLHWAHMTFVNSALLLNPSRLMFDYRMGAIPLVMSFLDARNLLTVLTISSYFLLGLYSVHAMHWWQRSSCERESSLTQATVNDPEIITSQRRHYSNKQILLFGLALMAIPYVPASNLFFPVGFVVAERVLYLPSMGLCLCAAHGIWRLLNTSSTAQLTKLFFGFLLLTHTAKTVSRNRDWVSKTTMYGSLLRLYPTNGYTLANLAREYRNIGDDDRAESAYRLGMTVAPNVSINFVNLGSMLKKQQRFNEAEKVLYAAVDTVSRLLNDDPELTHDKLASLYTSLSSVVAKDDSRLSEALSLVEEGLKLNSSKSSAHNTRGSLLLRLGSSIEAGHAFTTALTFDPTNTHALYNKALVYKRTGEVAKSVKTLQELLRIDSSHDLARRALHELKQYQ